MMVNIQVEEGCSMQTHALFGERGECGAPAGEES